ncbi:Disintegrin and metalloproteinase domain-containing protein 12 [Bagarius yarrelli]|uniref:Disintegrin and metalloproteinase domain-containing protein 12 n=1 Tax=Bagarius yarrelli TaxID=175774 RepID=A0A556TPX8_BAGYA|nr:Disintegrin and metalloproteinase domain-containing protein 12 [Bagarius yarrelli]
MCFLFTYKALEQVIKLILPDVAHRFLFGPTSDFPLARLIIGAAFGAIIGTALFFGLMYNIPLLAFHKVIVGYVFIGPIFNIQHNVEDVIFSMGCNIDLQIGHSKMMWRTVSEPFFQVLEEIVADSGQLQREAQNVSRSFQGIKDEVMGEYGYNSLDQNLTATGNSTQEQFTAKTMMRCEYVVKQGIDRCVEWFSDTWLKCMDTIKSPVISHFLCMPMKFGFLCNIMRVMNPWCKEQIPVEGNFGQTFDKLSSSISKLGEEFTTNVVLKKIEDQPMFGVSAFQDEFRKELARALMKKKNTMDQILRTLQIFLSLTFITVFVSAFRYARQYTRDICFDNVYITTYFKQIDKRRRIGGKRYLLPLKKAERSSLIEPCGLKIHSNELRPVVVSLALCVCALLLTDRVLYQIFDIIRKHTFIEQSFSSSHDINIDIRGESMLAKLLRKTVGAFNTSSNIGLQSNNWLAGRSRGVKPLEKTRPFVIIDGQRSSLRDALQNGHPDRLLCGLHVGDRLLLLDLDKNHELLPKPLNIFYYLPNGIGVSMEESQVVQCYYHGSVRGFPQSRVAISTCDGLRGVIVINASLSFELQPETHNEDVRSNVSSDEVKDMHLLYPTQQLNSESGGCGVSHTFIPPIQIIPQIHRTKRDILLETKYIELVLVVDHKEFYRPLNVRVALVGLEIWSDQDKILIDKSPGDTLSRFLDWRNRELLPRLRHDNAQLIMGESFDGTTVGMASQSSMCTKDRSGGVNVDHLVSVLGVASTVAHELGHNLGMNHDTAERRCQCQNERRLGGCIMEPSTGFMPGQLFSSCSEKDLSLSLMHGGAMCLFNVPQPEKMLGGPRCGNLYVEKGEECDCGLLNECTDPCCNASTCKLVQGAKCSSDGICCENCKLRVAGSLCREPLGECDLPEYCTGFSSHCPPNVFLQNGETCQDGTSYCYSGVCTSIDEQCHVLWGTNSTRAPPVCFSSVNKQGNMFGNCGQMPNGTYIPCLNSDVQCGRIQCQGGSDRPLIDSNSKILTTKVKLNHSEFTCRGAFFHLGDDVSDPAMVAQGTACAPGKMCNSNKNCHCDVGWAPPDCKYSDSNPLRVGLLVIFLFVLPVILLFLALRFPRCRRRFLCFNNTPFSKARQSNRTPATERVNTHNGEQILPLRYQWTPQNDIPLTRAISKAQTRPAPPTKPLPPDPVSKQLVQSAGHRPAPPNKPLPPDPAPSESKMQQKLKVKRPAAPSKPLPPDPVLSDRQSQRQIPPRPPVPRKPLPADPSCYPAPLPLLLPPEPSGHHTAAAAACANFSPSAVEVSARRPMAPPIRAAHQPRKFHKPPQV